MIPINRKATRKKKPWARYSDPRYNIWRLEVLKRDDHRCKTCGSKEALTVHHIKSYARYKDLRFDLDNGITLCSSCHKKIHSDIRKRKPRKKQSAKTRKKISESLKRYYNNEREV